MYHFPAAIRAMDVSHTQFRKYRDQGWLFGLVVTEMLAAKGRDPVVTGLVHTLYLPLPSPCSSLRGTQAAVYMCVFSHREYITFP